MESALKPCNVCTICTVKSGTVESQTPVIKAVKICNAPCYACQNPKPFLRCPSIEVFLKRSHSSTSSSHVQHCKSLAWRLLPCPTINSYLLCLPFLSLTPSSRLMLPEDIPARSSMVFEKAILKHLTNSASSWSDSAMAIVSRPTCSFCKSRSQTWEGHFAFNLSRQVARK